MLDKLSEGFSKKLYVQLKLNIFFLVIQSWSCFINFFLPNSEDLFNIKAKDLGKLSKIKIGHDNTGGGPAWYLDKVSVLKIPQRKWLGLRKLEFIEFYFPCCFKHNLGPTNHFTLNAFYFECSRPTFCNFGIVEELCDIL